MLPSNGACGMAVLNIPAEVHSAWSLIDLVSLRYGMTIA